MNNAKSNTRQQRRPRIGINVGAEAHLEKKGALAEKADDRHG